MSVYSTPWEEVAKKEQKKTKKCMRVWQAAAEPSPVETSRAGLQTRRPRGHCRGYLCSFCFGHYKTDSACDETALLETPRRVRRGSLQ